MKAHLYFFWVFLGAFSAQGQVASTLWNKTFEQRKILQAGAGPAGGALLTGRVDGPGSQGWALRLDSLGETVWEYLYPVAGDSSLFNGAAVLSDGRTALIGSRGTAQRDAFLTILAADGTFLQEVDLGATDAADRGIDVRSDQPGRLHCLIFRNEVIDSLGGQFRFRWWEVQALDANTFQPVWTSRVRALGVTEPARLLPAVSGEWLLFGSGEGIYGADISWQHDLWMVRLGSAGEHLESRNFGSAEYETLQHVTYQPDRQKITLVSQGSYGSQVPNLFQLLDAAGQPLQSFERSDTYPINYGPALWLDSTQLAVLFYRYDTMVVVFNPSMPMAPPCVTNYFSNRVQLLDPSGQSMGVPVSLNEGGSPAAILALPGKRILIAGQRSGSSFNCYPFVAPKAFALLLRLE